MLLLNIFLCHLLFLFLVSAIVTTFFIPTSDGSAPFARKQFNRRTIWSTVGQTLGTNTFGVWQTLDTNTFGVRQTLGTKTFG
jgi:hypothetical protein